MPLRGVPGDPRSTEFRLTWRPGAESRPLSVAPFGCVRVSSDVGGGGAYLPFPGQGSRLAAAQPDGTWLLETFTRNQVPLYRRRYGDGSVAIANDVSLLIDLGEDIELDVLTLLSLVTGSARTVFSNLFKDIELLLPGSLYRISDQTAGVDVALCGIAFDEVQSSSAQELLEQILEYYRQATLDVNHVALGLSGGYDSRFELALYKALGKNVTALHHITSPREARFTARVAKSVGARFVSVPLKKAAEQGWDRLQSSGFTTRWDGFFAPGTVSSWGLIDFAPADVDSLDLLSTGSLKGRLYGRQLSVEDWLEMGSFSKLQRFVAEVPSLRRRVRDSWEDRRDTFLAIDRMLGDKIERDDVRTDFLRSYFYKMGGRAAGRVAPFVESGKPLATADRSVRETFSALPVQVKQESRFLEFATATLNPELGSLPYITSSDDNFVRALGPLARVRGASRLSPFANIGSYDFNRPVDGRHTLLETIPQLAALARMTSGKRSMEVSMVVQLLARLQYQHGVRFHVDDPDGLDALLHAVNR